MHVVMLLLTIALKLLERMETEVSFITGRHACVWVPGRGTRAFLSTDANELLCEKIAKGTLTYPKKYRLFNEAIFFVFFFGHKVQVMGKGFTKTMRFIWWL